MQLLSTSGHSDFTGMVEGGFHDPFSFAAYHEPEVTYSYVKRQTFRDRQLHHSIIGAGYSEVACCVIVKPRSKSHVTICATNYLVTNTGCVILFILTP